MLIDWLVHVFIWLAFLSGLVSSPVEIIFRRRQEDAKTLYLHEHFIERLSRDADHDAICIKLALAFAEVLLCFCSVHDGPFFQV